MDRLYLVEIFIDTLGIFAEDVSSVASTKFKLKIKFGPKTQFIIREAQLLPTDTRDDGTEKVETKDGAKNMFTRKIRIGVSYLFPSCADAMIKLLKEYPLEVEIWNCNNEIDDEIIGIGTMVWDRDFYVMLRESQAGCETNEQLSIKTSVTIRPECCCTILGNVRFILRISALGDSVITDFQQLLHDPDMFYFRTNKAPSLYECQRIEDDDARDGVYATTIADDPKIVDNPNEEIEVCTELQSCAFGQKGIDEKCEHPLLAKMKAHKNNKIRMGDITGPCGNTNCPVSHKIKNYIRNMDSYKKDFAEIYGKLPSTAKKTKKICGACDCKDDQYHYDELKKPKPGEVCQECGGIAQAGETCSDKAQRPFGTGLTPKTSNIDLSQPKRNSKDRPTQVNYSVNQVVNKSRVGDYVNSVYRKEYTIGNMYSTHRSTNHQTFTSTSESTEAGTCSNYRSPTSTTNKYPIKEIASAPNFKSYKKNSTSTFGATETFVYNAEVKSSGKHTIAVYQCTDISEGTDCKCSPLKPSLPCKTIDCGCIEKTFDTAARKKHKPFCPCYKHKETCPVTLMKDEEELKELEEEPETEPLPYGLPPIKLGPCPVMGRPCSVPDGFARMYKNALQPAQPPSYSDAGKVCCSKEYQRIKGALKEYMKYQKDHEYKCINKYNVDTERRCCDREQLLFSLSGKSCCGSHKLAIQDQYKAELQRQKEIQKK